MGYIPSTGVQRSPHWLSKRRNHVVLKNGLEKAAALSDVTLRLRKSTPPNSSSERCIRLSQMEPRLDITQVQWHLNSLNSGNMNARSTSFRYALIKMKCIYDENEVGSEFFTVSEKAV